MHVCLFVWGFSSNSRIFYSYGDATNTGEGLQILTYARHSWPLSSEGLSVPHLLRHGTSIYNGHVGGPVTLIHYYRAFGSGAVTTCFYNLCLSRPGFEHPTFHLRGERFNSRNRRGVNTCILLTWTYTCIYVT